MPSPKDELASIFDVGKEMGIIFSRRGGCGVNLSKLRPKGARVHNSAITSTGAVSFVQYYDNMASTIGAEGRRAALLVALEATHPDIADFLKLKANDTSIQMANLSVIFNDNFMGAVYAGDMYTLHFKVEDTGEEIKKEIDARKLFMEFCELNRRFAEPGAIFIDTVRDYNMLSAYPKEEYLIECCNPCAEYYGAEYNACCLGSINLFNCVENPCTGNATFDFGKLRYLTSLGVRVLDEVLDIGYDAQPLDAHRKAIKDWRAIGLGVMGMADMLVAMGFEYGSKEANKFLEDVFREIRDMSLIESSCLAKSFGSFGNFDSEKVLASRFFHTVPDRIKGMIKKYGLRNGNLMSIAPSGTISTMIGVSNGVEPYFKVSYTRSTHTNVNEGTGKTFEVFAKAVELLMKKQNIKSHSELPDYIVDTYQMILDHYTNDNEINFIEYQDKKNLIIYSRNHETNATYEEICKVLKIDNHVLFDETKKYDYIFECLRSICLKTLRNQIYKIRKRFKTK
jgi:ribonucleoside-diphosphate reductase alpha chain